MHKEAPKASAQISIKSRAISIIQSSLSLSRSFARTHHIRISRALVWYLYAVLHILRCIYCIYICIIGVSYGHQNQTWSLARGPLNPYKHLHSYIGYARTHSKSACACVQYLFIKTARESQINIARASSSFRHHI